MPAYWLARVTVSDPDRFAPYRERVPGIIKSYGGRYLAVGGRAEVLEGSTDFKNFVVIEFPSIERARACYRSTEYQEISALRADAGKVEIVVVEGAQPVP